MLTNSEEQQRNYIGVGPGEHPHIINHHDQHTAEISAIASR